MTTENSALHIESPSVTVKDLHWNGLYKAGGLAALLAVMTGLLEIVITFLPGGNASPITVLDWFALFQNNWFMGLRNLGLLNIFLTALAVPIFLALYMVHRHVDGGWAALAMIISFIGVAVFYATNRAFAMLDLSRQYAAATTEVQRSMVAAAGQSLLSVGESHTPGTFIGFFLSEVAGIVISVVMLRSKVFSMATAYTGFLGFGLLSIYEICSSFLPAVPVVMLFAMGGGLLVMAWYILVARRLFQVGHGVL